MLGNIRLHAHQRSAVASVRQCIRDNRGALLADAVGLGKTYVALAVARGYREPLVIAPAVLRRTWDESSERSGTEIRFISTESLSRSTPSLHADFVVVDEAHHFRNPQAQRYARLARIVARAPVLLLTATPIHNTRDELISLLALFLGSRAAELARADIAVYIIRREHEDVRSLRLPRAPAAERVEIPADPGILDSILALPASIATRGGGMPSMLVRLGLAHAWCSSDAAFLAAARRRMARGQVLRDTLAVGRLPSRRELESWSADEFGTQLCFSEILAEKVGDDVAAAALAIEHHLAALRRLLDQVHHSQPRDLHRVEMLRDLLATNPAERIVAFSSYAETVIALYRAVSPSGRVAMVTGRGARIASGRCPTDDVIEAFRQPRHERERIRLLLATDLLSEGLNLPEATLLVHLDLPWTAARLEQRVGRVRRAESRSAVVRSYVLVQPDTVERRLRKELLLARKRGIAGGLIGEASRPASSPVSIDPKRGSVRAHRRSPVRAQQLLRQALTAWRNGGSGQVAAKDETVRAAAVTSDRLAFLALVRHGSGLRLLAGQAESSSRMTVSDDPRRVLEIVQAAAGDACTLVPGHYCRARRTLARALRDEATTLAVGWSAPRWQQRLLRRLAESVSETPLHTRAACARRVAALRAALGQPLPIAIEWELDKAMQQAASDSDLITSIERTLAGSAIPSTPSPVKLVALLLLVPRD